MTIKVKALLAALALWPGAVLAEGPCRATIFEGTGYTVCEVRAGQDVRLFHTAADGKVYGTFGRVELAVKAEGRRVVFAMNAGMYHGDRSPVGLLVESGTERAPLVTAAGPGNFGLRPNGVFCVRGDGRFAVIESRDFAKAPPDCPQATQSGPMLVIGGALHPRFLPGSDSVYIRNGVGVSNNGSRAVFAISDRPVNFHRFARFFRDVLGTPDALYLDGQVSRLHAPGLGRSDWGFAMGPIVALVD